MEEVIVQTQETPTTFFLPFTTKELQENALRLANELEHRGFPANHIATTKEGMTIETSGTSLAIAVSKGEVFSSKINPQDVFNPLKETSYWTLTRLQYGEIILAQSMEDSAKTTEFKIWLDQRDRLPKNIGTLEAEEIERLLNNTLEHYFSTLRHARIQKLPCTLTPRAALKSTLTTWSENYAGKQVEDLIDQNLPQLEKRITERTQTELAQLKVDATNLVTAVLNSANVFFRQTDNFATLQLLGNKIQTQHFETADALLAAIKGFVYVALQQNAFKITNTTSAGLKIQELLNTPQYSTLKNNLFLNTSAYVRYRDIRSMLTGSDKMQDNERLFSYQNRGAVYGFWNSETDSKIRTPDNVKDLINVISGPAN